MRPRVPLQVANLFTNLVLVLVHQVFLVRRNNLFAVVDAVLFDSELQNVGLDFGSVVLQLRVVLLADFLELGHHIPNPLVPLCVLNSFPVFAALHHRDS